MMDRVPGQPLAMEGPLRLPPWAVVSPRRLAHVRRVVALLEQWAVALRLEPAERDAWRDAGWWHDALRDEAPGVLRAQVPDAAIPAAACHGVAAAVRLAIEGEARADVLEAVRWHTLGSADWARTGRALYLADYLEPGRGFARAERAFLAQSVPVDFDGVLRQVVRLRLEAALRDGLALHERTVALWHAVR